MNNHTRQQKSNKFKQYLWGCLVKVCLNSYQQRYIIEIQKSGFDEAIGVTRIFMRLHGIWPGYSASKIPIVRYSFVPAAFMIFFFINGPQTIQVFQVNGDLNAILNVLTLADVPIGIALIKLLGVSLNQSVLHELIISLSEDWKSTTKPAELDVMWQKARVSRTFSVICIILGECVVVAYSVRMFYVVYSTDANGDFGRPLYMTGKFPFDTQTSPKYEITWILQIIATILSAGAFSSVDALFVSLALHLCGQLINLQKAFKEIGQKKMDKTEFIGALQVLVRKHQRINEFADVIEYSFNMMFLFQVLSSTLLLCLQGYLFVIISGKDDILIEMIFMFFFTVCFTFSVFVYCYVAELLREESLQVANAIFYSKWYNLPAKRGRWLVMCLIRVQKPLEITAGKFCVFSMNLFCHIVKTSAGYMSVLLAMRDKLT